MIYRKVGSNQLETVLKRLQKKTVVFLSIQFGRILIAMAAGSHTSTAGGGFQSHNAGAGEEIEHTGGLIVEPGKCMERRNHR